MKTVYFLSNNLMSRVNVIYPKTTTFNEVREKTMLSTKGEEVAKNLVKDKNLASVSAIYSSPFTSAISTCKYIAEDKDLEIYLDNRLGERVVGELGCNEYRFLKGMQEHDFTYKLENGESLEEVKNRMVSCLKEILNSDNENILIVTHNIALLSLFLAWCHKDFNLDDHLILDYQDEVVFDGIFHEYDLIEVKFDGTKVLSIQRLQ